MLLFSWFSALHGNFSIGLDYLKKIQKKNNVFDLELWYIINQQNGSNSVPYRYRLWMNCRAVSFLHWFSSAFVRLLLLPGNIAALSHDTFWVSLEIWHFSFTQLWVFSSCFLNGSLSSRVLVLVASEQRHHYLCCFSLITATISPVLFASLDLMWCCRCFWNVRGNACTIWKGGVKSSVSRQGFN